MAFCRQHGVFDVPDCTAYTSQLFTGLRHLHSHLIMHRDTPPSNGLLRHGASGTTLTICKWGSSRRLLPGGAHGSILNAGLDMSTGMCREPYRPPEVWAGSGYDLRLDVWPAGMIAMELYTRKSWWKQEWNIRPVVMKQLSVWLSEFPRSTDPSAHLPALADCFVAERPPCIREG